MHLTWQSEITIICVPQRVHEGQGKRQRLVAASAFCHRFTTKMAWLSWRTQVATRRSHRTKLEASSARRTHRQLRASWRLWTEYLSACKNMQKVRARDQSKFAQPSQQHSTLCSDAVPCRLRRVLCSSSRAPGHMCRRKSTWSWDGSGRHGAPFSSGCASPDCARGGCKPCRGPWQPRHGGFGRCL